MFHKTGKYIMTWCLPEYFFIPGLIGMPLGAVSGGYHGLTTTNNPNLVSRVVNFTMCIAGGTVIGGIVGTIWPISVTSYVTTKAYFYINKK